MLYSRQILIERFLRLEAWVYFLAQLCLKKKSASIKPTHNILSHLATFLQIVEVLRHFVILLTVTSIFNKAQPVLYTIVVVQRDGTGF